MLMVHKVYRSFHNKWQRIEYERESTEDVDGYIYALNTEGPKELLKFEGDKAVHPHVNAKGRLVVQLEPLYRAGFGLV